VSQIEVIAQRGAAVLIRVDEQNGRILDCRHRRLFPAQSIESALARGYWVPFSGDPTEISELLAVATEMSSASAAESGSGLLAQTA
jgi:hypothetical protein